VRILKSSLFIFNSLLLSSCASFLPDEGGGDIEQTTAADQAAENRASSQALPAAVNAKPKTVMMTKSSMQGLELKQARLWARVDELEDLIRRQKGRIKMLEKGLLLGVVPAEFGQDPVEQKSSHSMGSTDRVMSKVEMMSSPSSDVKETSTASVVETDEKKERFQSKMAKARDLFRSGRYGKAYLEFSKIDKEFSTSVASGEQKYWLGRCWHKLKEFQSARQHLQAFVGQYPSSPWTSSAKFHLAKVELDLGLKEAAIRRFQQIIRENPYEGTAEAAKQILGTMHKAL